MVSLYNWFGGDSQCIFRLQTDRNIKFSFLTLTMPIVLSHFRPQLMSPKLCITLLKVWYFILLASYNRRPHFQGVDRRYETPGSDTKNFIAPQETSGISFIFLSVLLTPQALQGWCGAVWVTVDTVSLCHNWWTPTWETASPPLYKEKTSKPVQALSRRKTHYLYYSYLVNRSTLCFSERYYICTYSNVCLICKHNWEYTLEQKSI